MEEAIKSPRIIGAVYYLCLSVVATLFIQFILYSFQFGHLIPFFWSLLLSLVVAILFGALFGKAIISSSPPYKARCFILGILIVLLSVPVYDIGLLFILKDRHPTMYHVANNIKSYGFFYLFLLIYTYILVASWLCIVSGFASVYLRNAFIPGFIKFSKELNEKKKNEQ